MKKKRPFTLLEIMLVIFLIGLIGSIIGYNMKGSLDEGKAFKTEQAILKVQDILELQIARGADPKKVEENPAAELEASGVLKKASSFLKDGWGVPLQIEVSGSDVIATSERLEEYRGKKAASRGYELEEE